MEQQNIPQQTFQQQPQNTQQPTQPIPEDQPKKSNKKVILIVLLVLFIPLCLVVLVLGGVIFSGVNIVQDVNKDSQIKSLMLRVELEIIGYREDLDNDRYPDTLEEVESGFRDYATSNFDSYKLNGNKIEIDGYEIIYKKISSDEYSLTTTLHDRETYEVISY